MVGTGFVEVGFWRGKREMEKSESGFFFMFVHKLVAVEDNLQRSNALVLQNKGVFPLFTFYISFRPDGLMSCHLSILCIYVFAGLLRSD